MPVYLDHAATTPMLPEAIEAYTGALGIVGNPSSIHSQGQNAKRMLEEAREQVASSLGCDPIEIVFTSGGTESINLAVKGLYWARNTVGRVATDEGGRTSRPAPRPRILVPLGEHHATIDTVEWLERYEGAIIEWLPLDSVGRLSLEALAVALDEYDDVALITLLWANNEVGTIQPIAEVVELATRYGVPVHADAVSVYKHLPIDFRDSGLAALSVSAHKIGGPLGIGALVLSRSATVVPLIHGGGQQRDVRSGTQDAPAAISFGVAAQHPSASLTRLRDRVIAGVRAAVPEAVLHGDPSDRVDNNAHFTFPGCEGDSLLFLLDVAGVSVSTGSACRAGIPEPSHVLLAMGLGDVEARGALRITVGHSTTEADVDAFLAALPEAYARASRAGLADRDVTADLRA
ncbi:cysteine desulfurase family protein [Lacisediminihabitans changchengi]|uniref:Cysteine desulfurase n=1 Tax=Lacisediminihabitans changchengi TaxID=2787634 RepID=A0A934SJP5_9MICO|nr:cysteine desulfurase family protein [Lacisediminihabitans changchengi]MBK4346137.1 cysteine desulfurase [Lacisediminihabitans changchengi]